MHCRNNLDWSAPPPALLELTLESKRSILASHGDFITSGDCHKNSHSSVFQGSLYLLAILGINVDKNPTPFYATYDQLLRELSLVGDGGDI